MNMQSNNETNEVIDASKKDNVMNKKITPKFLTGVYIALIAFMATLIILIATYTILKFKHYNELKAQAEEIREKYNIEAQKKNNMNDSDYADIYFDGDTIYIPSEDVIIEYKP